MGEHGQSWLGWATHPPVGQFPRELCMCPVATGSFDLNAIHRYCTFIHVFAMWKPGPGVHVWPCSAMGVRSQVCPFIYCRVVEIRRYVEIFNFGPVGLIAHPMDRGTGPFYLRPVPISDIHKECLLSLRGQLRTSTGRRPKAGRSIFHGD